MADISRVLLPDNETYNVKDLYRGCEFVYGTQTATTNVWKGNSNDSELVDGKQILYFLPFAGNSNSATLELTLSDGTTTGAKNVYFQSTTRMTTHYGQYSQFRLIYHQSHKIGSNTYEGWWSEPGRDTTTTNATQIQLNSNALKAGSTALARYNIIVANENGLYQHLKSGNVFDITYPIVYLDANVNASASTSNVYTEINFTVSTTQSITLTAQKPVYIKGTLNGKLFTPISTTPLTQTIPSEEDGFQYIYLGYGYSSTAVRLQSQHPIFEFRNGIFCLYEGDAKTVNGHTVDINVPADAVFTDTTYENATTTTSGLMSSTDKIKLDGIATGAEVNQNAFSNIKVGSTTVSADTKTDTFELVNGSNITLTPDATNDKVTIALNDSISVGTLSATDLQAGDILVTGAARFNNTINGTATYSTNAGSAIYSTNAGTAASTPWNGITGKPSTFAPGTHTHTLADITDEGTAAAKNFTTAVTQNSNDLVTSGAVWSAIDTLPEPMIFKGTLGTGGTITTLPTASAANEGFTYKVITAGTYASQAAKVGDVFVSNGSSWVIIPAGDTDSDTWRNIKVNGTEKLGNGISTGAVDFVNGDATTVTFETGGKIKISHADTSTQSSVNNSGRTYIQDITIDTYGHVTGIASATETVVNTDRYVNAATFADDSTNNANNPVKMTLTRDGSDTNTVTANIPKVSTATAGVVPKGAAVSTQSQSTKFLREDGTWAAPSYTVNTNTTYTISKDGESVKLTGSNGGTSSVSLSSLINGLSEGSSSATTADYLIAQYVGGGTSTTTYHRRKIGNVVNKTVVDSALGKGSDTTKYYRNDGTWAVPPNTTYSLTQDSTDGHKITLTPSSGTAQTITIPDNNSTYTAGAGLELNGSTFSNTQKGVFTVIGNQSTATNAWTGALHDVPALYDGLTIMYYLPWAGTSSSATLNLTLDDNTTTGAVACYYGNTTRLTTHYGKGSNIIMTYWSAGSISIDGTATTNNRWIANANYDSNSNTYDRNKYAGTVKCGTTAIVAKNIIVADDTGAYKHLKLGTAFDINYPILYANSAIAANATGTDNYDIIAFTVTTTQSITLTAYKPVYIKGTLSGSLFTPVSTTPLTQSIPSASDGYQYMLLGIAYSSTAIYLATDHRIFAWTNTQFREILPYSGTYTLIGTENLNDVIIPGFYNCINSNTISNMPSGLSGSGFGLEVIHTANGAGYYVQKYYRYDTGKCYRRYCNNNTWSNWTEDKYTDTTYTLEADTTNNKIVLKANGTAQNNITVPYATNAGTATRATNADTATYATNAGTAASVPWSGITNPPSTFTPGSHTHGNIQNGGTLQTNDVGIASGDKLVITDSSDSNKVARSTVTFDGSTTNKCLTPKGTWESFTNNSGTITKVQTTAGTHSTISVTSGTASFNVPTKTSHLTNDSGFVTTDTKNTAGSTDTSSKIFLIGATTQTASTQTFSDDEVYTTSGILTTKSVQVGGGSATMQYNSTTKSIDFVFA